MQQKKIIGFDWSRSDKEPIYINKAIINIENKEEFSI